MKRLLLLPLLAIRSTAAVVLFSTETVPAKYLPEDCSSDLELPIVARVEADASLKIPCALSPMGVPMVFPFHDEKATSVLLDLFEQDPDKWSGQMLRTVSSAYAIRGRISEAQFVSRRLFEENTNKVDSLVLYAKMLALDPTTRPKARETIAGNLENESVAEALLPILAMIDISSHDWDNGRQTMFRLLDLGKKRVESLPRLASWVLLFLMVSDDIESNTGLLGRLAAELDQVPPSAFSEEFKALVWLSSFVARNKAKEAGMIDEGSEASLTLLSDKGVPFSKETQIPFFGGMNQ